MNSQKQASVDHPVHDIIARRWSPYGYSDRPVSPADLRSLFEAARWAASSYNAQPWSYLVATRKEPEAFSRLLQCLVEGKQTWASTAPVLAIGCSKLNFAHNGLPNKAALHDLGLASANLTFEATARGLCVHQMGGILPDKIRDLYAIPEGVQPLTALAIGYPADPDTLSATLRERDLKVRERRPLMEFVFSDKWGVASTLIQ